MSKTRILAATVVLAAVLAAIVGCETEKLSDRQLSISPAKATIAPGASLVLTAQGGWDYVWSEPDSKSGLLQYGTLSAYNGKKVTYTAPERSSVNSGDSESYTNAFELTDKVKVSSASNLTATAIIVIRYDGE